MTTTMTTTSSPEVRRHPIRGALWGLAFGLGLALLLIGQKVIAFGTLPPLLVILGGLVAGLVWGLVAPAKGEAPPPTTPTATVGAPAAPWADSQDEIR